MTLLAHFSSGAPWDVALIGCLAFLAISDASRGSPRRAFCALEAVFGKSPPLSSVIIGEVALRLKFSRTGRVSLKKEAVARMFRKLGRVSTRRARVHAKQGAPHASIWHLNRAGTPLSLAYVYLFFRAVYWRPARAPRPGKRDCCRLVASSPTRLPRARKAPH